MFSRKRFLAGASAVALAAGTSLAGAGVASAQDEEESTGSLSSSSLDLGDTAADLALAATALNGPVTVSGNAEGGPTVAYTNETSANQVCVGFTLPYATVDTLGVDPSAIGEDPIAALPLLALIEAAGGVSVLTAGEEGVPVANDSGGDNTITNAAIGLLGGAGVEVSADETVEWIATAPEEPAAGVIMCTPDPDGGLLAINFGIDRQVVVDQLNNTLPGGSISAGSVSGGSVSAGATVLGSLASASAGDDADTEEPTE